MKYLLSIIAIQLSLVLSAQSQSDFRGYSTAAFGGNLAVGDADFLNGDRGFKTGLGLNGGVEYFVVDGISVNLEVTKYFQSTGNQLVFGVGNRNYWYESGYLSLNGKYYVESGIDWLQTYGLLGVTHFTSDYQVGADIVRPVTKKVGANIGVGAIALTGDFWNLMVEYRYATPEGAMDTPRGGSGILIVGLLYIFKGE